jgi:hypothetical protein
MATLPTEPNQETFNINDAIRADNSVPVSFEIKKKLK